MNESVKRTSSQPSRMLVALKWGEKYKHIDTKYMFISVSHETYVEILLNFSNKSFLYINFQR